MAFNLEDKIKWSELAPSLQKKFTDIDSIIKAEHDKTINQMSNVRTTISRVAPSNPTNNKELWADEKYRVLRAFSDNFWEFTRAGWAAPDTPAPDPGRENPEIPDIPITPSVPTKYEVTFLTAQLTAFGGVVNPGPEVDDGFGGWMFNYLGKDPSTLKAHIKIEKNLTTNNSSDLLAYILIAIGPNSAADGGHLERANGTAIKIDGSNSPQVIDIDVPVSVDQFIIFDVESMFIKLTSKIQPGDIASEQGPFIKFDKTQYPYSYPVSTLGTAITPADKPIPPFATVNGTVKITITCSDMRIQS